MLKHNTYERPIKVEQSIHIQGSKPGARHALPPLNSTFTKNYGKCKHYSRYNSFNSQLGQCRGTFGTF